MKHDAEVTARSAYWEVGSVRRLKVGSWSGGEEGERERGNKMLLDHLFRWNCRQMAGEAKLGNGLENCSGSCAKLTDRPPPPPHDPFSSLTASLSNIGQLLGSLCSGFVARDL